MYRVLRIVLAVTTVALSACGSSEEPGGEEKLDVQILDGPDDSTPSPTATFTFECSADQCDYTCELTAEQQSSVEGPATCKSGIEYAELAADTYTFEVFATDDAGRESVPATATWTVEGRGWQTVATGSQHTCAIATDGTLWCWGDNANGQLGDGTRQDRTAPTQVGAHDDWVQVSVTSSHTCARRADDTSWCWGNNGGKVGDGTDTTNVTSPSQVDSPNAWIAVGTGLMHSCAVSASHKLWCWGSSNANAQLGVVTEQFERKLSPVAVDTDAKWLGVTVGAKHNCARREDHTVWCWGKHRDAQLGADVADDQAAPVQIDSDASWAQVSAGGNHTCAIQDDQTLWCWGDNDSGQLGVGVTGQTGPVGQIGDQSDWLDVSAGNNFSCGIRQGGSLWCWGDNQYGQLGDGTTTQRTSPVSLSGDATWTDVSAGSMAIMNDAHDGHACAIRDDYTLWCWGANSEGQLGDDTIGRRLSPVQVPVPQ